ncbi:MAG: hypothetical protein ABIN74_02695, partial [Ferruginibacter sp.]
KRIAILSGFLLAVVLTSFGQNKCNIKKAYAFYSVSIPGAQMVDENGNPIPPKVDILRFIYFEWIGTGKPRIEMVSYNNKALSATLVPVKGRSVIPGSEFSENNQFRVTAKKGNTLWKIELQPGEGNSMPGQDCKNIIIKTSIKGRTCSIRLTEEMQLVAMPRY